MTTEPEIIIVVFGQNGEGRPHAAKFDAAEADVATRAAQLMGYKLVKLTAPDELKLASGLPAGRIYQTGKSFAPLTKQGVFDELCKLTPVELPAVIDDTSKSPSADAAEAIAPLAAAPASTVAPQPVSNKPTSLWEAIAVGAAVLARAPGEDSWWEAQVVGVSEKGKMLTLRWKGYDDEPEFMAPRKEVALSFPG